MKNELFHVFRNTPFGREVFLQSIYFSKSMGLHLRVFIPKFHQFLMYFSRQVVTVDLDKSFLRSPETAYQHAIDLMNNAGVEGSFFEPKDYTASVLPDIPVDFDFMTCPRSISDLSTRIGLGYIGPKVRSIINNARFPIIIPTPVYKEWKNIMVFFGGSTNALKSFRVGLKIKERTGFPLRIFTYAEGRPKSHYEDILRENHLFNLIESGDIEWLFFEKGVFRDLLYEVPHDALVVVGAYGHSAVKEVLFGSKMEEIHTVLPNNMVVVGPHYQEL